MRFRYQPDSGSSAARHAEPHILVPAGSAWYLICWDIQRDDWRTFRVDRLSDVQHTSVRFTPRTLTAEQVDEMITVGRAYSPGAEQAEAVIDLPVDSFRARFGAWSQGARPDGHGRTRWPVGGAGLQDTIYGLSWLPSDVAYTVDVGDDDREALVGLLRAMLNALEPVHSACPSPA